MMLVSQVTVIGLLFILVYVYGFVALKNELIKWVIDNKGILNNITIDESSEYNRRIIAVDKIDKDSAIVFIPESIVLSTKHKDIKYPCQRLVNSNSNSQIKCFAYYLSSSSTYYNIPFFDFYFKYFPLKKNFPLLDNYKRLRLLKGTECLKYLRDISIMIDDAYLELASQQIYYSFDDYKAKFLLIISRAFKSKIDNDILELIPIIDLFNHHPTKYQAEYYYDKNKKGYIMKAIKNILPGEEIYINYGSFDNSKLLSEYGFTCRDNPYKQNIIIKLKGGNTKQLWFTNDDDKIYVNGDFDIFKESIHSLFEAKHLKTKQQKIELLSYIKYRIEHRLSLYSFPNINDNNLEHREERDEERSLDDINTVINEEKDILLKSISYCNLVY